MNRIFSYIVSWVGGVGGAMHTPKTGMDPKRLSGGGGGGGRAFANQKFRALAFRILGNCLSQSLQYACLCSYAS